MNRPNLAPFSLPLKSDLPVQLTVFPRCDQPAAIEVGVDVETRLDTACELGGLLEANLRRAGRPSPAPVRRLPARPHVLPAERDASEAVDQMADADADGEFLLDASLDDELSAGLIYDEDDDSLPAPGDFYFEREDRDDD